jgi:hypothetical protein
MTIVDRPRVRPLRRHPATAARVNALLCRVLASPLARILPTPWALLRYVGRRSGRRFQAPIGVYDVDGRTVAFTASRWQANFLGGGPVEIVRRGAVLRGTATARREPERAADLMLKVLAAGYSPRQLGLDVDDGHHPTRADLVAMGRSVVELDLPKPAASPCPGANNCRVPVSPVVAREVTRSPQQPGGDVDAR